VFPPGRAPYSRKREKTFDGIPEITDKFTSVQRTGGVAGWVSAARRCAI
jgi:hypothetical protein